MNTPRSIKNRPLAAATLVTLALTTGCASDTPAAARQGPEPEAVIRAYEAGVLLASATPQASRDRLRHIFDEGATTDHADLRFTDGVYIHRATGEPFSGHASSKHPSGRPSSIHGVVDGALQGPGVWLFDDGSIHIATTYLDGAIRGQLLEFFPNGAMKLRVMAQAHSPRGGDRVGEITVGFYDGNDQYQRESLGNGRLQVITRGGHTKPRNDAVHIPEQHGYMLFHDGLIAERTYTTDSRTITQPSL